MTLNVHFHLIVPDGVFVEDGERVRFEMLPVPTNANVLAILDGNAPDRAQAREQRGRDNVDDNAVPTCSHSTPKLPSRSDQLPT